jgi:drug/metabolite transporter (DMT)-like permease
MKTFLKRFRPELLGLAVLLTASLLWAQQVSRTGAAPPKALDDTAKEALSLLQEMNKLLLSLAGLLIGAVVALVSKDGQLRPRPTRPSLAHLFLVLYTAAFSMYFGFVLYAHMLELLELRAFSATNPILQDPLQSQYYLFLTSLILLIAWVLAHWRGRGNANRGEEP